MPNIIHIWSLEDERKFLNPGTEVSGYILSSLSFLIKRIIGQGKQCSQLFYKSIQGCWHRHLDTRHKFPLLQGPVPHRPAAPASRHIQAQQEYGGYPEDDGGDHQEPPASARKPSDCPVACSRTSCISDYPCLQVCFTEMEPPSKIFQCGSGHLVCGGCKPRIQVG